MNGAARLAGLVLFAMVAAGCAYTNIQRPLDQDFDKTELGSKTGRSSVYSLLWLVAWGDGGTKAAAENGNIQVIRHADVETYAILLGLYSRATLILYGD